MMETLKKLWAFLDGKKSYLSSICMGIIAFAWAQGLIDETAAKVLLSIFGSIFGMSMRLAVEKTKAPNV